MHDISQFRPYADRSLAISTSWALGGHRHAFPERSIPNPHPASAQQLSGAHMPNGSLYDPALRKYPDMQNPRDLANRRTLNEHHVNLESRSGQWVKYELRLPFQSHSQ